MEAAFILAIILLDYADFALVSTAVAHMSAVLLAVDVQDFA